MEIVNVRIDERLIHGQVAAMWTGSLKVSRIMVVDNEIITSDFRKRMLKMACPSGVKLSILDTKTATENISVRKYEGDRIFVIVHGPEVLVDLLGKGFPLKEVNVGNMSGGSGTRQIKKTVCVTEEDEKIFRELNDNGISFYAQMVPTEAKEDFMALLNKK